MKRLLFIGMFVVLFITAACSNIEGGGCPLLQVNPDKCDYGTYTTNQSGCQFTLCRPSPSYNCNNLTTGSEYFDGCNTCYCEEEGEVCTEIACPEDLKQEGEMCGGIAGFRCESGLKCQLEGDYPDASGICINMSE